MPLATWHVIGASITGTSHLQQGRECEDVHDYRIHGQELLLIAVADGAGMASQSAIGARTAVEAAITAAERILLKQNMPAERNEWRNVLERILTSAREGIVRLTGVGLAAHLPGSSSTDSSNEPSLRDFATTLLTAIITTNWIAVAQIGDGAVVIQNANGSTTSLTPRQSGEFINETCFLTDSEYLSLAHYPVIPRAGMQGIALLTDGLQLLAMRYPENTPHQAFFERLFTFARDPAANQEQLKHFLASKQINSRTDDDKTLLLAVYQ